MIDIKMYRMKLNHALSVIQPEKLDKFAAWCCFALTSSKTVFEFLGVQSGRDGKDIETEITKTLHQLWSGQQVDFSLFDELNALDWDPDSIEMDEETAAQGATDLLAALSFLSQWYAQKDISKLLRCAENVVNRIDYLEGFELLDSSIKNPVDQEADAQMKFAQDLLNDLISDSDQWKYHEWLLALGI